MIAATLEQQLLRPAEKAIDVQLLRLQCCDRQEGRFQLLEAVASRFGGFELTEYHAHFATHPVAPATSLLSAARDIVAAIERSGIPPALAVSALARETLDNAAQRRSGAYHTDFRLASALARSLEPSHAPGMRVIDPACGAGMLLVALTIEVCGADRQLTGEWLARSVFAADLSIAALRGTQIALACLTDSVASLATMRANWKVQDSLLAGASSWREVSSLGFDIVIANPPWEKVKLSRHEFIKSTGGERHYGSAYSAFDEAEYESRKAQADGYGTRLGELYPVLRRGEPDLYVAFTELLQELARPDGQIALLLPGGLIRSQSTEALRVSLLATCGELAFTIIENRARYFPIDTRFKFLMLRGRKRGRTRARRFIELAYAHGTPTGVAIARSVRIARAELADLRPDLTLPEVRSEGEWRLFRLMAQRGIAWSDPESSWYPEFMREADMTRDRKHFRLARGNDDLPLVEGRMVHQHRLGAKSYIAGTGRSAAWAVNAPGSGWIAPQYWVDPLDLARRAQTRAGLPRAGFCDITGQTNERSCLAAYIPPGVICGNKVPTITFPADPSPERIWLWIALANSLAFDWLVRRVITTTINYFHLLSLPLPPVQPDTLPGRQLAEAAEAIASLDRSGGTVDVQWRMGELRARCDHLVLTSYGLTIDDLDLMLSDFPLLDRAQPPLAGETRSTITRDLIVAQSRDQATADQARARVAAARANGAAPYIPSQVAMNDEGAADEGVQHG